MGTGSRKPLTSSGSIRQTANKVTTTGDSAGVYYSHPQQALDEGRLLTHDDYGGEEDDEILAAAAMAASCGSGSQRLRDNNRTTDGQTMMHILKANIGTGVLAMPNAFKNVGLWLGFILVPIIGAICIHCMNILIASHNKLCDRFSYESLDYDQVASLGLACGPKFARRLAKYAHVMVTTFLIFTQLGFCCVYIMFVVENLQLAVLNLFQVEYSTTSYLLMVLPIIGLTSCTSNLKHLARISTIANVLQLTGLALIIFDLIQFHTFSGSSLSQQGNETTQEPQQEPNIEVNEIVSPEIFAGLPLFFATAVYAFEGIGVVLPLIKEMQHPERISGLNGILNSSMSMVAILYMAMGFFGYAKYGQWVQASITLNLPETMLNDFVRLIFALAIGLSYSLQFYVPWTIVWPHIDEALFYSYRPRVARDKLRILSKLSAQNEWAIDGDSLRRTNNDSTSLKAHNPAQSGVTTAENSLEQNSTASTFATSYTVSTCIAVGSLQQSRRLRLSGAHNGQSAGDNGQRQQQVGSNQYGSISRSLLAAPPVEIKERKLRNRFADVDGVRGQHSKRNNSDEDDEEEDSFPEVQWRPPPRSMRGQRKLVRYTVILLSVSFTFVAAALIPRLDLFISLIGALASSCLAIIFPAIIQVCTFWDPDYDRDNEDDDYNRRPSGGSLAGKYGWSRRRGACWYAFIGKNLFLILFGILGLITGSWISISQLGAVYLGFD